MWKLLLVVAVVLLSSAPASAAELGDGTGIVDVQRRVMHAEVSCVAASRPCRGRLRASTDAGPVTESRAVRLVPHRRYRFTLRLRRDGLENLGGALREGGVFGLRTSAGAIIGEASFRPREGCGRYRAGPSTALVKTMRIEGFGLYACARPNGRLYRIGPAQHLRVAGRFVAFAPSGTSSAGTGYSIRVVDALRRRTVVETGTEPLPTTSTISTAPVTDLVLRASGAVAWIEDPGGNGPPSVRVNRGRRNQTLDRSADIAPGSLTAADERTISWRSGRERRSAHLR